MRSPSSWAVAIRTPEGEITEVIREITSPMQRRKIWRLPGHSRRYRARRVAGDRLSRPRDLGQRRLAGTRRGRRDLDADQPGPDHLLVRDRDRLCALVVQGRPGAPHELASHRVDGPLRGRRGPDPSRRLHRLHPPHLAAPGSPARVPVPRRGAQGDQRARGGRRAHPEQRAEVQLDSPALRNRVFALGDGDRDLRIRVRGPAGLVLARSSAGSCSCP